MLAHLLGEHAHVKAAEPAAAILFRRAHTPHAGGLHLLRDTPIIVLGNFRGVGIEGFLDWNYLVADDSADLIAQCGQFGR
jgi:hypothetical protein